MSRVRRARGAETALLNTLATVLALVIGFIFMLYVHEMNSEGDNIEIFTRVQSSTHMNVHVLSLTQMLVVGLRCL